MPSNSPTPSSRPVAGSRTRVLTADDLRQLVHVVPGWGTNSPGGLKARNLADALDALREARNGCGIGGGGVPVCGSPRDGLCAGCAQARDAAISALLGGDDA